MTRQRYPETFKIEAVKQITERGRPVADVVDSIGQRNNHVKTCSCGGLLNETNIYSKGKSV
ncbi:transposase, partial [Aeromonas allosaccharophila]